MILCTGCERGFRKAETLAKHAVSCSKFLAKHPEAAPHRCRCGKRKPADARFCSDACSEKFDPAPKDAPATLTTHVDPEDHFRRTAIVIDEHSSVDLVLPNGTRLATINAFTYKGKPVEAIQEDNPGLKDLVAIIDLIPQEGARVKRRSGLLWFNRIGQPGENKGASRHDSEDHDVPAGVDTTIVSVQLERSGS